MVVFKLCGNEHVYDAFGNYENVNEISFSVEENSLLEAIRSGSNTEVARIGSHLLRDANDADRQARGFWSSGTFETELVRIEDESGNIWFKDETKAIHFVRESFGWPIEFTATSPGHGYFLSYAHKDAQLAQRVHRDLEKHGVRLWYDEDDYSRTREVLLSSLSANVREEITHVLRGALERVSGVVLLLSANSLRSEWVRLEVEEARKAGRAVLAIATERGEESGWAARAIPPKDVHTVLSADSLAWEAGIAAFAAAVLEASKST